MRLISGDELAELLGIHTSTVSDYRRRGMPHTKERNTKFKHGKAELYMYNVRDVNEWFMNRAVVEATGKEGLMSADEAKRRKLSAEAGLQEIELARRKGIVVDLEELERDLSGRFAEFRSSVRMIPARVSMQILGKTDELEIQRIILAELDKALIALMDNRFDEYGKEEELSGLDEKPKLKRRARKKVAKKKAVKKETK